MLQITLTGHAGQDPETKTFNSGGSITQVNVGIGQGYKDRTSGQWVDKGTAWVTVKANTSQTKETLQHVHKGSHLLVTGTLNVRVYQKQDGTQGTALDVNATSIAIIPRKQQQMQQPQQPVQQPQQQNTWASMPTGTDPWSQGSFNQEPEF